MTLFSLQGVRVKCLWLETLCRIPPSARHNPVELRGQMVTTDYTDYRCLTDWILLTCVLSDPAVYPDSRPDCQPGHSKVKVPTEQRHHCSPSSHRPAFKSTTVLKQGGVSLLSHGLLSHGLLSHGRMRTSVGERERRDLISPAVVKIQYWCPPVSWHSHTPTSPPPSRQSWVAGFLREPEARLLSAGTNNSG